MASFSHQWLKYRLKRQSTRLCSTKTCPAAGWGLPWQQRTRFLQDVGSSRAHDSAQLIELFDRTFIASHATCLRGGAEEPLYQPAGKAGELNQVVFTRDYYASALHEVAHWCVAGAERRRQLDYGYWYAPDGRSLEQQCEFERVEVKPQALEWLFSAAAGWRFRVSADNLSLDEGPSDSFKSAICQQAQNYCRYGINGRVQAFLEALVSHYRTAPSLADLLEPASFARDQL